MPLRRAPGRPRPDGAHIVFPMQDITNGNVVICKISEGALRKLTGSDIDCLQTMFDRAFRQAEALASDKYDNGQAAPIVTESDISPPDTSGATLAVGALSMADAAVADTPAHSRLP